jgi:rhodanese-related sulfurtransferase
MSPDRLISALKKLAQVFPVEKELGLIKAGAEAHGIKMSPGNFFTPLVMTKDELGAYNARSASPENVEILAKNLSKVKSLTVICEDYRQSAQAVEELRLDQINHHDAVLAIAGGPTQPREGKDAERHQALVEFISAFHEIDPNAEINLIAHNQKCGGHAHFVGTGAKALAEKGKKAEDEIMIHDLKLMAQDLIEQGVDSQKLHLMLAQVNEDDSYAGLKQVSL